MTEVIGRLSHVADREAMRETRCSAVFAPHPVRTGLLLLLLLFVFERIGHDGLNFELIS